MSARIVALRDVDPGLAARWRELGRVAPDANPFADVDFVLPADRWLDQRAPRGVLVVERGAELRFALPVTRLRGFRRIAVPAVGTWLHPYSLLGTPLMSPDEPRQTWDEVLRVLRPTAPWAVLGLFAADSHAARSLHAALRDRGRRAPVLHHPGRPVARRGPGTAGFEATHKKYRSQLLRKRRRLAEHLGGEVRHVDCGPPGGDLDRAVDEFLAMEMSGWKGQDGGAMACRPGHAEFFREMCRGFAAAGRLRLSSLRVADRPVAYQCDLLAGDQVFNLKKTFDETLPNYSPGGQLMLDAVTRFHDDGELSMFDSCVGSGTLSLDLFPDRRDLVDVLVPLDVLGRAAAMATPHLAAAYRRGKQLRRSLASAPGSAAGGTGNAAGGKGGDAGGKARNEVPAVGGARPGQRSSR
ncbi:MAG TPA: GNAT family N-acetyltransferase [Catenuloplanes sp.]|jgi:CelD/BcsL family acetyltransferase involved in cellulose biosynthesis